MTIYYLIQIILGELMLVIITETTITPTIINITNNKHCPCHLHRTITNHINKQLSQ